IGNLKNLKIFNVYRNSLTSFPESIKLLTKLEKLEFAENKGFKRFPFEICTLPRLEFLSLNGTKILNLPKCLKNMKNLKQLDISERCAMKNSRMMDYLNESDVYVYVLNNG
ncbi:MAG: leucine-rich repeat domain-containing protein, partial [Promethearchaeia archaeon]